MTTLILATGNAHKVGEIQSILGNSIQCVGQKSIPEAPTALEDAATFAGNALKKAVTLATWLAAQSQNRLSSWTHPLFVLADDSGLEVDALAGAPGVHSARFASFTTTQTDAASTANCSDAANNQKLLRLLASTPLPKRTARFQCILALIPFSNGPLWPREPKFFQGTCEGHIDLAPRGDGGFGYDPLFIPREYQQSLAELGEDTKNQISHRAQALEKLRSFLAAGPTL